MFGNSGSGSTAKAVEIKTAMRRRTVILVGRFLRVGGSSLLFVVVTVLPFVAGLEDPGKYSSRCPVIRARMRIAKAADVDHGTGHVPAYSTADSRMSGLR